jgi:predicted nucleic acid-binding protein
VVGLDSSVLIYFIEEHPVFGPMLDPVFAMISGGQIRGVLSVVNLIEVLAGPLRSGLQDLAARYRSIIPRVSNTGLISTTSEIAEKALTLRVEHNLRTPDAIVAATGILSGATLLLTNDERWKRITETRVLWLQDFLAGGTA